MRLPADQRLRHVPRGHYSHLQATLGDRDVVQQIKQNFPLHFFYGESANAIKIQIWVTLIANLLLTIMQRSLHRRWSFSNLATTVRITLMYYVDFQSFFENPEKDWQKVLLDAAEPPPQLELEF